jgi:hypothetical protein
MPAMNSAAIGVSSEGDIGHSELRFPRLRRKHEWSWQGVQVPGRMSDGLASAVRAALICGIPPSVKKAITLS